MLGFRGSTFINGYLERKTGGRYEGKLTIDGVDLSPISGVYFVESGTQYLWIKRKPLLEYDEHLQKFNERSREPRWEAYLSKQSSPSVAYKGECALFRFKYKIEGVWDSVIGIEKSRLNLFVERLPMSEQTIINKLNERNLKDERT